MCWTASVNDWGFFHFCFPVLKKKSLELIMNLLHVLNDQFSQFSKISNMITNFMMTQSSSFEWKPSFPSSCVRNLILVVNILISALEIDVKWSEVWEGVSVNCWAWLWEQSLLKVMLSAWLLLNWSLQWSGAVPVPEEEFHSAAWGL